MAFGLFQRDQSSTVIFQPLTPILSPSRGDINPNACSLNGGEPESPPPAFSPQFYPKSRDKPYYQASF